MVIIICNYNHILFTLQPVCYDNMLGCCVDSSYDLAELCVELITACNYSCVQLHAQFHNATKTTIFGLKRHCGTKTVTA